MTAAAIDLLQREISNPDTQWSLGTFGAIAEFSRDHDEPVRLVQSAEAVSAVTPRGGIALKPHAAMRAFASEGITRTGWNQRIALCLPQGDCAMNQRVVLTEIGPDHQALREEDRELRSVRSRPRRAAGGFLRPHRRSRASPRGCANTPAAPCSTPAIPPWAMILAANPHRVFISRLGRIEVYQPIPPPSGKSPEGPHTHVLPRLLKSGRTHPATEPVPEGLVPCAHLYPPHPARDGLGEARPFDATHHDAFQRMMAACGDPAALATKRRVVDAVLAGRAAHGGRRRPPRPDQRPHCVAANEVAGARVSGAERLACELRFCGPRRGRRRSCPSS